MSENDDSTARLEAKLDVVIRLLALSLMSDSDSLKERASKLQRAGLGPKDIAKLCDSTPNSVSVALSALKRRGRKRSKR